MVALVAAIQDDVIPACAALTVHSYTTILPLDKTRALVSVHILRLSQRQPASAKVCVFVILKPCEAVLALPQASIDFQKFCSRKVAGFPVSRCHSELCDGGELLF